MSRRWYYEERSSYPLRKPAENVQRDSCEKNQQTPMRVSCTITHESNDALIVMPTSIPNFCGNCASRINTNYILLKRSSWRRLASTGAASTSTAHILNGLGIDSDLAPSAMSVRKCLKIGVGVYNRNSSSIGSTTHANSTQQQNQQQQQQTPKRISSQSGRKPAWKLANQKG